MNAMSNVHLRALEMSDLNLLYEVENDESLACCTPGALPLSRAALKKFIQRALTEDIYALRQLRLVIEAMPENNMCGKPCAVGIIDLFDFSIEHRRAEVGVVIFPPYRRKGYATAAVTALCRLAYQQLSLHQLYAYVQTSNEASIQLFQKAGFAHTALLQDWFVGGGKTENAHLFQRILGEKS